MRALPHWSFLLAALVAAALAVGDPYLSSLLPNRTWEALRLLNSPVKAIFFVIPLIVLATIAWYYMRKAPDHRTLLIILLAVAMQTNGIKLGGLDLIIVMPFVAIAYVLGESFVRPSTPVHLTAITFFGLALLLLDVPFFANLNIYGPARWMINFVSAVKGIAVGIAMILLIDSEKHLHTAVKATVIVGVISAAIGIAQMGLHMTTGLTLSLVSEEHETKPTFLGTVFRASGLTTWSQHLADYSVLVVPFLLFALMRARGGREALIALGCLAVVLVAAFFTFTYAAYFAISAMCALFPFLYWPHRAIHFVLILIVVGSVFALFGGFDWVIERGIHKVATSSGIVERHVYMKSTITELTRDPWLGAGFYAEEEFSENFYRKRVHNTGLQAWSNLGIAGFVVFMTMMIMIFTQLALLAMSRRGAVRHVLQALWLGLCGMIIVMFAEPNLTIAWTWYFLGLASAALRVWSPRRYVQALA